MDWLRVVFNTAVAGMVHMYFLLNVSVQKKKQDILVKHVAKLLCVTILNI